MRNQSYLNTLFIICFLGIGSLLNAQIEIGLQTRHVLNSGSEIRLGGNVADSDFLDFNGIALSLYRSREKRLFAFIIGFNITDGINEDFSNVPEIFVQVKLKLFKALIENPKARMFFSIDPRYTYLSGTAEASSMTEFAQSHFTTGVEVPFNLNFEYTFSEHLKLITHLNIISLASLLDRQEIENPNLTPRQRIIGGFDFDANIFNGFRIGVSYLFQNSEQAE